MSSDKKIGVFLHGQRVLGWGYAYCFNSKKDAKDCMDPYGYRGYEYKEVGGDEITLDNVIKKIMNEIHGR